MNIILKGRDGSVSIMTLVEGADKEEAIRKFKEAHAEGMYTDAFEMEEIEMPPSREFRDAWTLQGGKIVIDNTKAKSIHLGRIRHARNLALEALDKEQLKCMSNNVKLKEIDEKKQILRDLPKNVKNLEWPEILPQ